LLKGGTSLAEVGQHCGKKMSQASAVQHWTAFILSMHGFSSLQTPGNHVPTDTRVLPMWVGNLTDLCYKSYNVSCKH
jgi:hypothetical protein